MADGTVTVIFPPGKVVQATSVSPAVLAAALKSIWYSSGNWVVPFTGMDACVVPVHNEAILPNVMVGGTGAFKVTEMDEVALAQPVAALDKMTSMGYTPAAPEDGTVITMGLVGKTC